MFSKSLFTSSLKTKNIAKDVLCYSNLDSTNDELWRLCDNNISDSKNLLIVADNQTSGKGRGENKWFSYPGKSLTFSFLLDPIFSRNYFNVHALLVPIAIVRGIKKMTFVDLGIKWPNDIIYKKRKLGGILIETKGINKKLNIGIGLNINELYEDFPDDLRDLAISLKQITGNFIQREILLANILNELNDIIKSNDIKLIINSWIKYCIHKNEQISFLQKGIQIHGIFKSINEFGQAIIQRDGQSISYDGVINIL